jgi:hypothetical protein
LIQDTVAVGKLLTDTLTVKTVQDTEPAWFYSAVAQAAAAIVGLIGAILGGRILEQLAAMRMKQEQTIKLAADLQDEMKKQRRWLRQFKAFSEKELSMEKKAVDEGVASRPVDFEYTWDGLRQMNIVIEYNSPDVGPGRIEKAAKFIYQIDQVAPHYVPVNFLGDLTPNTLIATASRMFERAEQGDLPEQAQQMLASDSQRIQWVAAQLVKFREDLLPRSFVVVFISLGILIVFGILIPLLYLPGLNDFGSKWVILAGLTLGLLGMSGYFIYQFVQLRKLSNIRWPENLPKVFDSTK